MGTNAIQLWDSKVRHYFLKRLAGPCGQPCNASEPRANIAQVLHLLNDFIDTRLRHDVDNRPLGADHSAGREDLDEMFLTFLCRPITPAELKTTTGTCKSESRREGFEDIGWAILNTKGFCSITDCGGGILDARKEYDTPLVKKLGIKPGGRLLIVNEPVGFRELLIGLHDDVETELEEQPADVIVFFSIVAGEVSGRSKLKKRLLPGGGLWVAWPKTSGVKQCLTFEVVQPTGLKTGLVDNKVCAIDATWTGLRFVFRKK